MNEKEKFHLENEKTLEKPTGEPDTLAKYIVENYPEFAPKLRKNIQAAARGLEDFSRMVLASLSQVIVPLSKIDWNKVNETWIITAENIGKMGWTIPTHMDLNSMIDIAEIENVEEMDQAFANFYSIEENYAQMRESLLQHDSLNQWKSLLNQCFENYEKKNHEIAIPSLFLILEGFSHHLLYPTYLENNPKKPKASLNEKYSVVRATADEDSIDMVFYASAQFFINKAFKFANFESKDAKRPLLINRNWVMHGHDNVSEWKDIDALRLFNAIHTLTILDFNKPNGK